MRLRSSLLLLLTTTVLGGTACVDNQLSLVISRFVLVNEDSNCTALASQSILLNQGVLDVGITEQGYPGYIAAPVVENRLLATGTTASVETNTIQLTGVEVELKPAAGLAPLIASVSRKFFVPAAGGFLAPAGGTASLLVEVIPRALAVQLAGQLQPGALPERVIASVRPVGKHAGVDIDGGPIDLPIDVCKYCLTPAPTSCPAGGVPMNEYKVGSCNPSQDANVTCCTNMSGDTVCGPDVPVMTTGM